MEWEDASLNGLGKHEGAIKYLDKAIEINPNYLEAWVNKAISLAARGKKKDAEKLP